MNRLVWLALLACAFAPRVAAAAVLIDVTTNDLYKRMLGLNGDVQTYKAKVHLDVALKSFPFISPSFDGNVYFKQPDRQAVVFDTAPALASQFQKVYPKVDAPSSWPGLYTIAVTGDTGGLTTFRLTPKKNGRVATLDVRVDDATATIRGYTWTYVDGGNVTFDQTFKSMGRDFLVDKQTGHVDLPSYKADVVSSFTNYELNVALPSDVFQEK